MTDIIVVLDTDILGGAHLFSQMLKADGVIFRDRGPYYEICRDDVQYARLVLEDFDTENRGDSELRNPTDYERITAWQAFQDYPWN